MGISKEQKAALNRFLDIAEENRFTSGTAILVGAIALCVENNSNAVEILDEMTELAKQHPNEIEFGEIIEKILHIVCKTAREG